MVPGTLSVHASVLPEHVELTDDIKHDRDRQDFEATKHIHELGESGLWRPSEMGEAQSSTVNSPEQRQQ
jgi:hypothetical protein